MMDKEMLLNSFKNSGATVAEIYKGGGGEQRILPKSFVINMVEKLDEPEVLSKEWIDRHITDGHNVNLGDKVVYADELDGVLVPKQELPVVQQVVADWYEQEGSRMMWWNWFYKWAGDQGDNRTELEKRVIEWMQDFNEGLFSDIFRYGYEIEKESLYYVKLIDDNEMTYLNQSNESSYIFISTKTSPFGNKTQFTEKEIKSINEHYWQFAKPVEEEEK